MTVTTTSIPRSADTSPFVMKNISTIYMTDICITCTTITSTNTRFLHRHQTRANVHPGTRATPTNDLTSMIRNAGTSPCRMPITSTTLSQGISIISIPITATITDDSIGRDVAR